jgi:uncharacterized membrane protein
VDPGTPPPAPRTSRKEDPVFALKPAEPQRETFLNWLGDQLPAWTREGLLTEDQARRIRARYDFREGEMDRRAGPGRLVAAILVMGALLVGAGILAFIASNWEGMPDAARLALVFTGVVGLNAAGYELAFRRADFPRLGQALLLAGALAYGAGVFLVAQIFHLSGDWTGAFLLWGVGALTVAAAVRSAPVFGVAAAALAVWAAGEAVDFERNRLVTLGVLAGTLLPLACWRGCAKHAAIAAGALAVYFAVTPAQWDRKAEDLLPSAWLAVAGAFVAVAAVHARFGSALGAPWRHLGAFGAMAATFALGFKDLAEELAPRAAMEGVVPGHVALLVVAGAAGALALALARDRAARIEAAAALAAVALGVLWLLGIDRETAGVFALASNFAFFGGALGLVAAGYRERRGALAYQGLAWFGLGLVGRYCEYGYRFIDKSLFFVVGGLLLLGLGWAMELQRRRIASALKEGRP